MGILATIVVGIIAGWLAGVIVKRESGSILIDMLIGLVGSFVGGFIMEQLGYAGLTGFNIWSILVSTLGAVVVLVIWKLVRR